MSQQVKVTFFVRGFGYALFYFGGYIMYFTDEQIEEIRVRLCLPTVNQKIKEYYELDKHSIQSYIAHHPEITENYDEIIKEISKIFKK